ncbi:spermatogenesis-associated protein 13-like isoform X3 [Stegodyphus dumicola]|uniref:spermatogenesis-associated protein 13-like isoform X3 n=1 Tax=Stegodyphus dumicola TaxID=202533 RepID=UPI0015A87134|nr:spermatogenesis-associated protein 13-like isoform X3 [Stegodyphus dumicola]
MRLRTAHTKSENKTATDGNASSEKRKCLSGDEELPRKLDVIMGLGSNHVLNEANNCCNLNMVEEYTPFKKSEDNTQVDQLPVPMSKNKSSTVLRLRSKTTSRSERRAKGKSTSEVCGRIVQKTLSDTSDCKKRPTSQFYDLGEFESKTEPQNLLQFSGVASGSQPALSSIDQISGTPETSPGLMSRYLPLHTSTPQLSPADSLLQRFRKSFAMRFQKKKSEPVSSATNLELLVSPLQTSAEVVPNDCFQKKLTDEEKDVSKSLNSNQPQPIVNKDQPKLIHKSGPKNSPKIRRKEPCVNSDSRKRNKRKTDWRMSLIYDSVDNIFDKSKTTTNNKCHVMPHLAESDANILRKRAASTSDYSPKSKAIQRPVSVADCLTLENSSCIKIPDGKQDVSRAASDIGNSEDQQKNVTSLDQIWRANPVKLCRVHSRLLMCRHKGRYRLRRSISQPVELEMTGSIHNLRDSTHGSADHDSFQKGSLSSDDEASSESDIYHSYCCSPTRRSNTCWELSGEGTMYAEALWDHETLDSEELPFQAGDIIEVTDTSDHDWWWGTKDGNGGWFPSAFVRLYVNHRGPSLHFNGQQSEGIQIPYSPCKVSMNNLSCEQVRANIVQEIVATERDYVKHLKDVVEGYLKQVHRRPDMFSKERIETVFGNIKEIYNFQSQFLKQLEDRLDKDSPHLSQIGDIFLNHKEEFKMYSQYCNNHPLAVSELQELYCDSQYIHFFEACRLLQEMIDISLDGFLLTPIQRICKYPLQLAELLKFTDASHPDHIPVTNALAAMKDVAELVNERKRRMECLERIAEWQSTIEGWEGPDVLDTSSILIHCGEVTRVSSSWSRDIYLFIFDHQLIYCKKDLLKRHTYAYKGRLNLDYCDIVDAEDGKDSQFAVNVKNAWKIYCRDKDKWYLFYAKTSPEKDQWLRAFKAERQRVIDDENQAFVVTEEAKKSARLAVHNKQKPKRPRAKFTKGRRCHPDAAVTELLLDSPSAKARSGSLPSNIHPELAIMAGAKLGPTRKKGSGWFHFGSGKKPKS